MSVLNFFSFYFYYPASSAHRQYLLLLFLLLLVLLLYEMDADASKYVCTIVQRKRTSASIHIIPNISLVLLSLLSCDTFISPHEKAIKKTKQRMNSLAEDLLIIIRKLFPQGKQFLFYSMTAQLDNKTECIRDVFLFFSYFEISRSHLCYRFFYGEFHNIFFPFSFFCY